jgi:alcohol dehydrogenase, propanol-preferring
MCERTEVTGVSQNGGWQEFMLAPAPYVAPLPDTLGFVEAAPLMCAGLTVHNGLRNGGFEPGNRVAVIGLGGLGHLAVQYAHAMGGRVAVLSTSEDKHQQAQDLGAELFVNTQTQDPARVLASWDGGADIILSTAPSTDTANASLGGLAPDGTLVVLGVSNEQVSAAPMELIGGRRRVMGSPSGSRNDLRQALEFAATHRVLPQITSFALDDVGQALARLEAGKMTGRAVLTMS